MESLPQQTNCIQGRAICQSHTIKDVLTEETIHPSFISRQVHSEYVTIVNGIHWHPGAVLWKVTSLFQLAPLHIFLMVKSNYKLPQEHQNTRTITQLSVQLYSLGQNHATIQTIYPRHTSNPRDQTWLEGQLPNFESRLQYTVAPISNSSPTSFALAYERHGSKLIVFHEYGPLQDAEAYHQRKMTVSFQVAGRPTRQHLEPLFGEVHS